MKTVFVLSKRAIRADYLPLIEQVIVERRVLKETRQGLRVCALDAPENYPGHLFMRQHYDFFDTRADLLEAIASQANAAAAELENLKRSAVGLMCDAHDLLKREPGR
jgi:hypothetical protein